MLYNFRFVIFNLNHEISLSLLDGEISYKIQERQPIYATIQNKRDKTYKRLIT